jgi:hypothetical protein
MSVADRQQQQQAQAGSSSSSSKAALLHSVIPEGRAPAITQRRAGPLSCLTSGQPTNQSMLVFRTLNPAMGRPNANDDHLAPLLMRRLMPARAWWLGLLPWHRAHFRVGAPR